MAWLKPRPFKAMSFSAACTARLGFSGLATISAGLQPAATLDPMAGLQPAGTLDPMAGLQPAVTLDPRRGAFFSSP